MSVPKSLLALALLGLAAAQTATAQTTSPVPAATSVEIPGGLRSPERLGTLVRSDTRRFAEPGLGISVTYDGPARATF